MRISIKTKLAVSVAVPILGLLAIIISINGRREYERARGMLEEQVVRRAEAFVARLDEVFRAAARTAEHNAAFLGNDNDLQEREIYDLLGASISMNPLLFGAAAAFEPYEFDPQKRLFAPYVCRDTSGPAGALRQQDIGQPGAGGAGYDYTQKQWEWYNAPMRLGRALWTEPYFDEGAGNVAMCTFSAPIRRAGRIVGIATVDVRLDDIQPLELDGALAGEELALISRAGTILSFPEREVIMRLSLFEIANRFDRPDIADLARRMIAGERGMLRLRDISDAKRIDYVAFAPIPSTGWSLFTSMDEREVLAPVYRHMFNQGASALAGVLVLLGVLWWVAGRVTRPIRRLSAAVSELASGNLQARAETIDLSDEVGDLARGFNQMVAQLREKIDALTRATALREAAQTELRVARDIQQSMLPRRFPTGPGLDIFGLSEPARVVGGDFFDCFELPGGRVVIVVADVSGKGVPAAMVMSVTRTLLRELMRLQNSPGAALTTANDVMSADNDSGMFVTIYLAVYEPATGLLRYANAGHPPPLIEEAPGAAPKFFGEITGTVLGAVPEATYDEREAILRPGSRIVLYTDGVTEARSPEGQMLGEERLLALATGLPGDSAGACQFMREAVEQYQKGVLADDMTVVVLRRTGAATP